MVRLNLAMEQKVHRRICFRLLAEEVVTQYVLEPEVYSKGCRLSRTLASASLLAHHKEKNLGHAEAFSVNAAALSLVMHKQR
jgi:hypothetical protein